MSVAVSVEFGIPVRNCVDRVEYDTGVLLINTEGIRKSFGSS